MIRIRSHVPGALAGASLAAVLSLSPSARGALGGFETSDGYIQPFTRDVWSYDAGQTGAVFTPPFYNTGRWQELFGSGNTLGDAQYLSQYGFGSGGAGVAPFALAVRAIAPSTDGSYNMQVRYATGADDLGISPATALLSSAVDFDICPGMTVRQSNNFPDNTFNNVPAFSLSFGGTNAAPGVTVGFTDHDPANNKTNLLHYNGGTYVSQPFAWSGRFDHMTVQMNYVTGTFDVLVTTDANPLTAQFDPGNIPVLMVAGASFTNSTNLLDSMFFRTHTDPSDGTTIAGLEKSFLDNFRFTVTAVPEPALGGLAALLVGAVTCTRARRR